MMFLLGNLRAGAQLETRDIPTQPGVMIEGRICAVEKAYRVRLTDVTVDGESASYAREVIVTLMQEEGKAAFAEPVVGQTVCGKGRLFAPDEARNPGGIDWRIQTICKGYELSGYLLPGWAAEGEEVFSVRELFRCLRLAIIGQTEEVFGAQAALFQGIMLGEKTALDDEVTAAMRLTGTAHVLTVSGLHLSMIAGFAGTLLGKLLLRRRSRFALLSFFLVFFVCLTGGAAGTIRACIMVLLRELAVLRGRRYEPLTALSFAALCMTLVQPLWLLNASFQFSFYAVLGIQLFSRSISGFLRHRLSAGRVFSSLLDALALSLSAQIGSVPMQMMLYGYVPMLSLPMNVICGMFMPVLLLGGWGVTLLSFACLPAGMLFAGALSLLAQGFERFSLAGASLDGAILRLPAPYGVTILLILAVMLFATRRIHFGGARRFAVCLLVCAAAATYLPRFDPCSRYVQLDVGQGDAAVLRSGRRAVLMDVGPADSYDALRYIRREGLFVDAVILSHLDEDHAGALSVLLDSEVDVNAVIIAEGAKDDDLTEPVASAMSRLDDAQIPLHELKRGDRIETSGMRMEVLSPDRFLLGSNERSLLMHAQEEGVSILLTGDLPIESEPYTVPDIDVLKVAHHGSRNSTSDAFLAMASPEIALISVGEKNGYGHPHERVLDSLKRCGAQVLRTDLHGCITLWLRDGTWTARSWLSP